MRALIVAISLLGLYGCAQPSNDWSDISKIERQMEKR